MSFTAAVQPFEGKLPTMTFRWDQETEILSGTFRGAAKSQGLTGSVELEGPDGSFVVLDIVHGMLRGIEVVVWPQIDLVDDLTPPVGAPSARLTVPAHTSQPGIAAVELDSPMIAERNDDQSIFHLRVGPPRKTTAAQLADHLIVELDHSQQIAGFWLLNVPPFPPGAGLA